MRSWHGRVQAISDRLLDAVADQDRFDLIAALGYPLPVTVIAEMLGVPAEDMDRFEGWSNDIALIVEPILTPVQVESSAACDRRAVRLFRDHRGGAATRAPGRYRQRPADG